MRALQKVTLKSKILISALALSAGAVGLLSAPATNAQVDPQKLLEAFPLGSGGPTTNLQTFTDGDYVHKENKGANANGKGTAQYQKTSGGFPGAPLGSHGVTSYVDGAGNRQHVDFTHPDDKKRPVIVFIHGGGWRGDGGQYGRAFRERVAQHGFASFRIKYRLMPDGTYGIFNDVMNAIKHVRENAETYNIDPARVITWGDSAGGSLSVRTGASGKSGSATAVGWSAPTNAIRSIMTSPASLAIGVDHSTCFNTQFTGIGNDIMELYRGHEYLLQDPERLKELGPADLISFANSTFQAVNVIKNNNVVGQLKQSLAEWGIDADRVSNAYSVARDSANRLQGAASEIVPQDAEKETGIDPSNTDLQAFKDKISEVIKGLETSSDDSKTIKESKDKLEKVKADLPEKPGVEGKITIEAGKQAVLDIAFTLRTSTESSDINNQDSIIGEVAVSTKADPNKKAEEEPTDEDALRVHVSMLVEADIKKLSDALAAVRALNSGSYKTDAESNQEQEKPNLNQEQSKQIVDLNEISNAVSSALTDNSNSFNKATNDGAAGNPQMIPVEKIAECADNIIQTSPALFADPKSPPMFLANASHEQLVPPQDAYEMRDKLHSFGTRAEVLILPGTNHMGYDERAVEPTLAFLKSVNHPEAINR